MKRIIIAISILLSTTIIAQTSSKNFIDQNYIEVVGKAEIDLTPDQIYLKISLNESDFKNKKSIIDLEKMMIDKLIEIGVNTENDLTIKDLASNFKYYWLGKTEILVSKEYQLLVHDAMTAGKVFSALEGIEISNIEVDKLEHSKIKDYRKQVKIDAIKAAKEKASDLATAIDQNIGRAIYIEEIENSNFYITNTLSGKVAGVTIRGSRALDKDEFYKQEFNVEFEKINIEYTILCRFELK